MSAFRISAALVCVLFSLRLNAQTDRWTLDRLIAQKSYFEARRLYAEKSGSLGFEDSLYYGALIDNAFNRPEASLRKIFSMSQTDRIPRDRARYLLETQHADFARTGQYKKAADCIAMLLSLFDEKLSSEEKDDYLNSAKIWSALASVPSQIVTVSSDAVVRMKKDKAGLWTLPVSSGRKRARFIFDTGANLSTVPRSTAERMKMDIYKADVDVSSITGSIVKADLAVCHKLRIGNIVVQNAVFLVFPDEALTIGQIDYKIQGILGFPVIEGLNQITVTQAGVLKVPQYVSESDTPNLALDFLTPIAEIGTEYFTFDSGATNTILYPKWYEAHKETVSAFELDDSLKYGGAGGAIERPGYSILWKQKVDGKLLELPDVMVFSTPLTENEKWFFGNIGQDVIRSFESYTINFRSMRLTFNQQ